MQEWKFDSDCTVSAVKISDFHSEPRTMSCSLSQGGYTMNPFGGSQAENIPTVNPADIQGKLRNMTSIYLLKGDRVLLLFRQNGRVVDQTWVGSAGGHFEEWELNDAKACVIREMREELGIAEDDIEGLRLRYITLRRTKGEIRQNYYFFANLKPGVDEDLVSNEGVCRWFPLQEVKNLEMPYTAKYVIEHYCKIGRNTSEMYVGIADGGKVEFVKLPEY